MINSRRVLRLAGSGLLMAVSIFFAGHKGNAQISIRAYVPIAMRDYPAPPTIFGMGVNEASSGTVARLQDTQSSWTRLPGIDCVQIEPTEGARNWSAVAAEEQHLIALAQAGVKVSLIFNRAPLWAQRIANQYCGPVKPDKYPAMRLFVRDLVNRYSAPPYNVEYFEFWNEPDAPFNTNGVETGLPVLAIRETPDPYFNGREYGTALAAAYDAAKAANQNVKFMVGGLLMDCGPGPILDPKRQIDCPVSRNFLEGLLITAGGKFDGVSFHAYDVTLFPVALGKYGGGEGWQSLWNTTGPVLIAKSRHVKNRLSAAGDSGKFLINTEVALVAFGSSGGTFAQPERELTKAYYVPQSYAAAVSEGLIGNIWYDLNGWLGSGLITASGSETDAYKALKIARNKLANVRSLGPVTPADLGGATNVLGFKFNRGDRKVWVVWSKDGASHTANFATAPLEIVDALGAAQSTGTSLPITIKPLYIEWP